MPRGRMDTTNGTQENSKRIQLVNAGLSGLLIFSIAFIVGYTLGFYETSANSFPEIRTVNEINPGISTLHLIEVRNGQLIGKIEGRKIKK